jgi:hypothetical protein
MKIGPLSLFEGCIAAWHWKWSLTWRWILSARRHQNVRLGPFAMRTHCGGGVLCGLNTPLVDIAFGSQPNMRRDN